MQPMPHPDSWFIDWLTPLKLVTREQIAACQKKLDQEMLTRNLLAPDPPTLASVMEREGLLTKEQRVAGEREAGRRRAEFSAWRSQTLQDQHRQPPPQR